MNTLSFPFFFLSSPSPLNSHTSRAQTYVIQPSQYLPRLLLQLPPGAEAVTDPLTRGNLCPAHLPHTVLQPRSAALPKSLLLRNTLHHAAIEKLWEAAGLLPWAELCCRPVKQAAARVAHTWATTRIPYLWWKKRRLYCTSLSQVSHLSAAHLVHLLLVTTGHTPGNVLVCIN